MADALTLTRQMIERWNAGDFEGVFATWDPDIVVRPDPEYPEGTCFGAGSAQRF
jgi:hypothetical protein